MAGKYESKYEGVGDNIIMGNPSFIQLCILLEALDSKNRTYPIPSLLFSNRTSHPALLGDDGN